MSLQRGQPVLLGFPQDEGVRRNQGRTGAVRAPEAIRHWLYRLTPTCPLLDLGNIRCTGSLEQDQVVLGEMVADLLKVGAVPIVLGGGHETAYGHYLGYLNAGYPVGILNLDAHLDVRPLIANQGHSGSPFRQALEHAEKPLPGRLYACLGAQPHLVSQDHADYVTRQGGMVSWAEDVRGRVAQACAGQCERFERDGCQVLLSLDADVVAASEVPGVSAPNVAGLSGLEIALALGQLSQRLAVTSFELVEINPEFDRDNQSARWAALAVWHFLRGLSFRQRT